MPALPRLLALLLATMCSLAASAAAQVPAAPPAPETYYVPSKRENCQAEINAERQEMLVRERGKTEILWRYPGWRRSFLLFDCHHGAIFHVGRLLSAGDIAENLTIISFLKDGNVIRTWRLKELIFDLRNLVPANGYWRWGETNGIDQDGRLTLETVEKRRLHFDPSTGAMIEP